MNEEKKDQTYPKLSKDEFGNHFVTLITDDDKIQTLRITKTEHERLLARSNKEYSARSNTFWNRLDLAFKILFQ